MLDALRRLFAMLALAASPALAQPAAAPPVVASEPSTSLAQRAAQLPDVIAGQIRPTDFFDADFLAAVPEAQILPLFATLRSEYGAPQSMTSLTAERDGNRGRATITMASGILQLAIAVGADGKVSGLRIVDAQRRGDSIAALATDMSALPGVTGWGLYRLGEGAPQLIQGAGGNTPLAIGSVFKLSVLGALDAEITAGRMRWTDVVRVDRHSIPSGQLQTWPLGAPVTLHTLASLMISISDNTAADTLLRHIGRDRVEAFARVHGGLDGPNAFPVLGTREATVLKNPALGALRQAWLAGGVDARRELLRTRAAELDGAPADPAIFANRVADIDRIEWFASPDGLARLMGWFVRDGSADARAILTINSGIPPAETARWQSVGFKGGSEPGVMAMSLLLRGQANRDYAVVMLWNNPVAEVDQGRLALLAARASALLATVTR